MKTAQSILLSLAILLLVQLSVFAGEQLPGNAHSVIIYGDTRTKHEVHQKIVSAIMVRKPSTVFHTGDLVTNGLKANHWEKFNNILSVLRDSVEFYPALGNHENDSPLYFDNFDLPNNERWYTVDKEGLHFIVLDSNSDLHVGSDQYAWLKTDLEKISEKDAFVIAIFHHPPFSTCARKDDEMGLRESVVPLFEKYGVRLVFNGHGHCYERGFHNGIHYVVTGGGGARLSAQRRSGSYNRVYVKEHHFCELSMNDKGLVVDVFDLDSDLIDHFEVPKSGTP